MSTSKLYDTVKVLQAQIGLPENFIQGLIDEQDWSFVVKLHSLVEAVVTALLVKKLGSEKLHDAISHLPLSDKKSGKLAFLSALDLLPQERKFVSFLSEVRNAYVHDVKNVSLKLDQYFASLSAEKKKGFIASFGSPKPFTEIGSTKLPTREFVSKYPKFAIYLAAVMFLIVVYFDKKGIELDQEEARLARELYEAHPLSTIAKGTLPGEPEEPSL